MIIEFFCVLVQNMEESVDYKSYVKKLQTIMKQISKRKPKVRFRDVKAGDRFDWSGPLLDLWGYGFCKIELKFQIFGCAFLVEKQCGHANRV